MKRNHSIAIIFLGICCVQSARLQAQELTLDWSDKSIKSTPSGVHKGETLNVTVIGVNDILYDYKLNVNLQTQAATDDLALLGKLLGLAGGSTTSGVATPANVGSCQSAVDAATDDLNSINFELLKPANNLIPSASAGVGAIALSASLAGWQAAVGDSGLLSKLDDDVAKVSRVCTGDERQKFLTGAYDKFDKFRKKVEGLHTIQGQSVASTGEVSSVGLKVTEEYKDDNGKIHTVYTFNKTQYFSSVLTLSGGILLSSLRHPTYVRQSVPNATDPVLAIDGGAEPVPYILGMLNYKLPLPCVDWPNFGFALSTGPVLRVGGSNNSSSFGYFNGISVDFWHRLYVTIGSHVGQFADIPLGFKIGQTIPPSFGQLTPTNRWSARLAIAITYKTTDLGSLSASSTGGSKQPTLTPSPTPSGGTPKPAPTPAGGAAAPSPTPTPTPTPPAPTSMP